jgi:glutamate-5-semialdehyde dehydrogenase
MIDSTMSAEQIITEMGARARAAAAEMVTLRPEAKNAALLAMADALKARASEIQAGNAKDIEAGNEAGLSPAMLDRLLLTDARIEGMIESLRKVASLDDPVGQIHDMKTRPNGLQVGRMRVPIGVIGIIYESRPNVTADAGALCMKSGNAVILRGGKEAIHSNRVLARIMDHAGTGAGLPEGTIQLIPTADRALVGAMLKANRFIDLIVPRGGKSLIERVVSESTIPVIKHYDGVCHVYVDSDADLQMASDIAVNAKVQRPGICNAMETLVLHSDIAGQLLELAAPALAEAGVELRGDERAQELLPGCKAATEEDWRTEYLDLILSIRIVDSVDEAIEFINTHGSQHTDSIVTGDHGKAMRFIREVDSACVMINASTRFCDGGEFGLGCEIGISTDKLHARGPMGLVELTTSKFIVLGDGQVRT